MNNFDPQNQSPETDPSSIPNAPTNGDYSNWDQTTQPADPNYQVGDESIMGTDVDLGTDSTQFALDMPEDDAANSLTIAQTIALSDTGAIEQELDQSDTLFGTPYEDEFVFGRDKLAGIRGVNSKDLGLIVGQIAIPTAPQTTENTQNVAGMYGSHWIGNNYGAKQFDIPVTILAGDDQDKYLAAVESIASAFISQNNAEHSIQFGAYPDRTYFGHFTQLPTFTFINPGMFDAQGTLTFMASNPKGYLDQESLNFTSSPYDFTPDGNTTTAPIIHFEFLKDVYNFGFSNAKGEKVFVGYDQNQEAPDLEPVVYKDNFLDVGTFNRLANMNGKKYAIAYGIPSNVATLKNTDYGQALKIDQFFNAKVHPFAGGTTTSMSYGTVLETKTFNTTAQGVANNHAWQVDLNMYHVKYYPRALDRIEAYLIGEDGTRLGRFGIQDQANGDVPQVYMLFGSSTDKENAYLSRGVGYRGIGNTTYAVQAHKDGANKNNQVSYSSQSGTVYTYKFSQSLQRTITTTTYTRAGGKGYKVTSTKVETAQIAFKFNPDGSTQRSPINGNYLYDAATNDHMYWIAGTKKGTWVCAKDFKASLNPDVNKVASLIEMTNLKWTVNSNSQKKVEVSLGKTITKRATKKTKAKTTFTATKYQATRSIEYKHSYYQPNNSSDGWVTNETMTFNYIGSTETGGNWRKIGQTAVKTSIDHHVKDKVLHQITSTPSGAVISLQDANNTSSLTSGLYGFRLRTRNNAFVFDVYKLDGWSAVADPNKKVASKTFTLPTELQGLALNQLSLYMGKTPIVEDTLDKNGNPIKTYADDVLAFSGLYVKKLLQTSNFDMPKIIAHKGDSADINVETEDVFINGRLANNYRSIDSTFPSLHGSQPETLHFTPDPTGATVTGIYRPAII